MLDVTHMYYVVDRVVEERLRQFDKFGEQNHPDGTLDNRATHARADGAKAVCAAASALGTLSWSDILVEEIAEALAETDPVKLEAELIQVAAVAVAWVEAIRRRPVRRDAPPEAASAPAEGG